MIATATGDFPEPAGDSLRERFRACVREGLPGLPVPELLRYVAEVAIDLDARTRPHGHVNPDTVRVVAGRARLTENPTGLPPTSEVGTIIGTPAYMAPEVWHLRPTAGSDQYALACTYAELRVGRPTFRGESVIAVMQAHLDSAPDLEGCADAERRVLERALAKDARQRFPTCRQYAEALRQAAGSEPS
jgi:serine/threonine protein kinase